MAMPAPGVFVQVQLIEGSRHSVTLSVVMMI